MVIQSLNFQLHVTLEVGGPFWVLPVYSARWTMSVPRGSSVPLEKSEASLLGCVYLFRSVS